MAPRPLDQNGTPQQPPSQTHDSPTHTPTGSPLSAPSVVQAGQVMLIISLVLILIVVVSICIHFYLKRKRRRLRPSSSKAKRKKDAAQPELQSQEKKMSELVGTPLCEIGESEPRHEIADVSGETSQRSSVEAWDPRAQPVHVRERRGEGGMFGDMSTRAGVLPEAGVYAVYMVR